VQQILSLLALLPGHPFLQNFLWQCGHYTFEKLCALSKIVVFLSILALFFLSWKLSLILVFGSFFVFFIRKCIKSKQINAEQAWKN
jgi:ABC-type multidrug transport system fused ATPase/permease subunit